MQEAAHRTEKSCGIIEKDVVTGVGNVQPARLCGPEVAEDHPDPLPLRAKENSLSSPRRRLG